MTVSSLMFRRSATTLFEQPFAISFKTSTANLKSIAAIDCAVERKGGSDTLISHVVYEVFCIAREALTNAYRHSGASRIVVES